MDKEELKRNVKDSVIEGAGTTGGGVVGAGTGAAVGFFLGGPVGAAAGFLLGTLGGGWVGKGWGKTVAKEMRDKS